VFVARVGADFSYKASESSLDDHLVTGLTFRGMRRKIVISGYYGFGNLGDEAILAGLLKGIRSKVSDVEILVISGNPQDTKGRHQVRAISQLSPKILVELRSADLFISGGGGLLQDKTSLRSLLYYLGLIYIAQKLNIPTFICAQGIGPLTRKLSRWLVKRVLQKSTAISVRDEASKKLLAELGIDEAFLTADLSFLVDVEAEGDHIDLGDLPRPLIGVNVRDSQGFDPKDFADKVSRTLALSKGSAIFLSFSPFDVSVCQSVARWLKGKHKIISNIDSLTKAISVIKRLDILVGMRLHSVIFANRLGIATIGLAYDPKVNHFMSVVGGSCLGLSSKEMEQLPHTVLEKLSQPARPSENLELLRERAQFNIRKIKELLEERYVLGLRVDAVDIQEALERIESFISGKKPHLVVTFNAEMAVLAYKDREFRRILGKASLVVADSVGVAWAARLKQRVAGVDLSLALAEQAARNGWRLFLLGASQGVARTAAQELERKYPGLQVVGTQDGYFSPEREKNLVEEIRSKSPDILLVGLGMGRQERWIAKYMHQIQVPVCMGVGGTIDVIAGKKKRAPAFIRKLGLEWLYRFLREPTRLPRMVALPKFVWLVWRDRQRA
jgi:N-acetylglucosaminyldiphosphoundecaprenol N-acetyl-beta-D-mannosaminyltransferase